MIKPEKKITRSALAATLWAMFATPAMAQSVGFLMPSYAQSPVAAEPSQPTATNRPSQASATSSASPGSVNPAVPQATAAVPASAAPATAAAPRQGSILPVVFSGPLDRLAKTFQKPGEELPPPAPTIRDAITQDAEAAAVAKAQDGVIRLTQPTELTPPADGFGAVAEPPPVMVQGPTAVAAQASAAASAAPAAAYVQTPAPPTVTVNAPAENLPPGQKSVVTESSVVHPAETTLVEPFPEEEYGYGIFKPVHHFWGKCFHAGLFGGVEGVFLAPSGDVNQSVTFTDLVNDTSISQDTEFGLGAGFRTWVGLRAGHSGFRATYFQLRNQYGQTDGVRELIKDDTFSSQYDIDASIFDFELFHEFCLNECGDSILYATLGARYAEIERAALTVGAGNEGNVDLYGLAHGATAMEGWGLTSALGGVHALRFGWLTAHHYPGYCPPEGCSSINFPWAFVWEVRGAVLQAETRASALTEAQAFKADPSAISYSRDQAFGNWDGNLAMGSLQLGLQYSKHIHCCPSVLSFASGFEGQLWQLGDVNARSNSFAGLEGELSGVPFGGAVRSEAEANGEDLALLGFFVRVGLSY